MTEAGVRTVFVPGGDQDPPAGDYHSAGETSSRTSPRSVGPSPEVGVTGHPESHPTIHDDLTVQAMWDKRRYATQIVSNLTFDPVVLSSWVRRMRHRGVTSRCLGVPGPIDRAKLLGMATKIGVGESTRFLTKHRRTLTRLAAPGGFTGERFIEQCAPALARRSRWSPGGPGPARTADRSR